MEEKEKSPRFLYQKQGLEQRPKVSPNGGDLEVAYFTDLRGFWTWH